MWAGVAGSVRRVNRRLSLALSIAAFATLSSACSTFSDSSNVARVDDATLSDDDFEAQLAELGAPTDQVLPADTVRAQITTWIQEQLAAAPGDTAPPNAEELASRYDAGIESSGILCSNAIVVADEETATRVAGELTGGAAFDELFAAENIDPDLATRGGDIGCLTSATLAQSPESEFITEVSGLSTDTAVGTAPLIDQAGTELGWVVLRFRDFAGLGADDVTLVTETITAAERLAEADIFVDPRYGTFDTTTGQVVGLG